MKKPILIAILVAGFLGFIAGNAFWYLFSPLWINVEVSEALPDMATATSTRQAQFTDADAFHKGAGQAEFIVTATGDNLIRFTQFESTNGPDLKVYLVKASNVATFDDVTASEWLSLGPLKGNIGDQNYTLPADANPDDYKSVVIWCEQFGVLFSAANF
jgi:hypothetical protein